MGFTHKYSIGDMRVGHVFQGRYKAILVERTIIFLSFLASGVESGQGLDDQRSSGVSLEQLPNDDQSSVADKMLAR
jgi:hypothetical protein